MVPGVGEMSTASAPAGAAPPPAAGPGLRGGVGEKAKEIQVTLHYFALTGSCVPLSVKLYILASTWVACCDK